MTPESKPEPMSVELLEEVAAFYDVTDTSEDMEAGYWVDPGPSSERVLAENPMQ
jgi:hypothetical protein